MDYSGLRSENQSAYWRAGRGTVQDKNVALSVDPPLFGADILDEIRAINRHSLRKAENYREN